MALLHFNAGSKISLFSDFQSESVVKFQMNFSSRNNWECKYNDVAQWNALFDHAYK